MDIFLPVGAGAAESFYLDAVGTPQGITSSALVDANGNLCKACEITAMNWPLLYAYNATPETGSWGHILGPDESMVLPSYKDASSFKFCNYTAGSVSRVVITPKF